MEVKLPRPGEALAAVAGVALLVSLFLPWYGADVVCAQVLGPCPPTEVSGWQAFAALDVVLVVAALGGIALLVLEATQSTPAIAVAWATIATIVALVALVGALYRTLDPPAAIQGLDPRFAFLGLAACAALAAGTFLSMRDETVR